MRIFKRALLCVGKRKSRSLLMLLVLSIVISLVFSGLTISSASTEAARLARLKLGSTAVLSFDMTQLFSQEGRQAGQRGQFRIQNEPVTVEMAKKLADLPHVIAVNYKVTGAASSTQISPVTVIEDTPTPAPSATATPTPTPAYGRQPQGGNVYIMGDDEARQRVNEISNMQYAVESLLYTQYADAFLSGDSTLIQGRHITNEDTTPVVLIETRLAEQNDLKLGDTIQLSTRNNSVAADFKIVGIYETQSLPPTEDFFGSAMTNPYNKIYVPFNVGQFLVNKFAIGAATPTPSPTATPTPNPGVTPTPTPNPSASPTPSPTPVPATIVAIDDTTTMEQAVFILDDPANMAAFQASAEKVAIDWTKFTIDVNETNYQTMTGPIQSVANTANLVVLITSIAGATILALILLLALKERTHEVGVLLSLGERKSAITAQLLAEVLLIAVLAFFIAFVAGSLISDHMANSLLQNELKAAEQSTSQLPFTPKNMGRPGGGFMQRFIGGDTSGVKPIDTIDVAIGISQVVQMIWMGLLIIFAAVLFPLTSLMRKKPREILIRHE